MTARPAVVVVTNLYPSSRRPGWGTFVADRVASLRSLGASVEVITVDDHPRAARRYASLAGRVARGLAGPGRVPGTVVEAHIAYPTGLLALPLARRLRAPLVLFAHGSDVLIATRRSRGDRWAATRLFRGADLVVANSAFLAADIRAQGLAAGDRLTVVSPGIAYARLAAERDRAAAAGELRAGVLFVGHLIPRKGADLAVRAVAEQPVELRPTLTVMGDGPERAAVRAQAERLEVETVFAGMVSGDQVAQAMARAEAVLVPSRQEALGLAALEAQAAGAMTVTTGVGGLAEVVQDGVTGFSAGGTDPAALGRSLAKALAVSRDSARVGPVRAAADAAAAAHDVGAAADRTLTLYARLLDRR